MEVAFATMSRAGLVCVALVACASSTPTPSPSPTSTSTPTPTSTSTSASLPPEPPDAPSPPASAAVLAKAYRALTEETLAPGSPAEVYRAALLALGASEVEGEASADALEARATSLIHERALGREAMWRAIEAMAAASGNPHALLIREADVGASVAGLPHVSLGMRVATAEDGRFVVTQVFAGGPAEGAGVKEGDVLVALDGRRVARGARDLFRYSGRPKGSVVLVSVEREGSLVTLRATLTAFLHPVVSWTLLPEKVALLRISAMTKSDEPARDTADATRAALAEIQRAGAAALVIDLRGNGGGQGVARLASIFTDKTPLHVARARSGALDVTGRKGAAWPKRWPAALLIDEGTTSAAEMFALALMEHGAAVAVGQPTCGALSVPAAVPLGDGRAVMVPKVAVVGPVTRRSPPGGRVQPDVLVRNRTPEDFAAKRDPQLAAALARLSSSPR